MNGRHLGTANLCEWSRRGLYEYGWEIVGFTFVEYTAGRVVTGDGSGDFSRGLVVALLPETLFSF